MIDNLHLIKPLLTFERPDDFYHLMVLKRKKDQPAGERDNHQSVRTIKSYCISSLEYLDRRYDEIRGLCELFAARAYIHVQGQNHRDLSMEMLVELATRIKNGVVDQMGLFDSVVGQVKTKEKRWVVDVDTTDPLYLEAVTSAVESCRPEGPKVVAVVPTLSGYHLITERFDVLEFERVMSLYGPVPDIQKKNPACLFVPDSLMSAHVT
jgi:hypothetical protein